MKVNKPYRIFEDNLITSCCKTVIFFDMELGSEATCECGKITVIREYQDWIEIKSGLDSIHEIR